MKGDGGGREGGRRVKVGGGGWDGSLADGIGWGVKGDGGGREGGEEEG